MDLKCVEIDCANTGLTAMAIGDGDGDPNFGGARLRILGKPGS